MPKRNTQPFSLDKFEEQINNIVNANDTEFNKLQQEFNQLAQKNDKISEILSGREEGISNSETDKLIAQLELEIRLEEQEKERGRHEDQKLEARFAKLKEYTIPEQIHYKQLAADGFAFEDNKNLVIMNLEAQTEIAKGSSDITTNPKEKDKLETVATKLGMMSQIIHDIPEVSKEEQPKVFNIIGKGLEKIYNDIKAEVSYALDGIKKLGSKLVESIKSIFKDSPEKQLEEQRNTLKVLYENFAELKGATGQAKKQFLSKHFNEINKLTTPKEFFKETYKITKSINKAGKDKLLDIKKKHIEKQKALHPNHIGLNKVSPSPTPSVNKGSSRRIQR